MYILSECWDRQSQHALAAPAANTTPGNAPSFTASRGVRQEAASGLDQQLAYPLSRLVQFLLPHFWASNVCPRRPNFTTLFCVSSCITSDNIFSLCLTVLSGIAYTVLQTHLYIRAKIRESVFKDSPHSIFPTLRTTTWLKMSRQPARMQPSRQFSLSPTACQWIRRHWIRIRESA